VRALPRRPGQKEQRYEQLLGGAPDEEGSAEEPAAAQPAEAERPAPAGLEERVARLEREVAALRAELGG
jgi:uncharacterized protein YceH (UPF0502 family)